MKKNFGLFLTFLFSFSLGISAQELTKESLSNYFNNNRQTLVNDSTFVGFMQMAEEAYGDMDKNVLKAKVSTYVNKYYIDDFAEMTLPYFNALSATDAMLDSVTMLNKNPLYESYNRNCSKARNIYEETFWEPVFSAVQTKKYKEISYNCPNEYKELFMEHYKVTSFVDSNEFIEAMSYTRELGYSKKKLKRVLGYDPDELFAYMDKIKPIIMCNCYYEYVSKEELEFIIKYENDKNVLLIDNVKKKMTEDVSKWNTIIPQKFKAFMERE